jgi:hypothetical protein
MPSDDPAQPKQKTPKGIEIPVPTRDDFLRDLRKVLAPDKPKRQDEPAEDEPAEDANERE